MLLDIFIFLRCSSGPFQPEGGRTVGLSPDRASRLRESLSFQSTFSTYPWNYSNCGCWACQRLVSEPKTCSLKIPCDWKTWSSLYLARTCTQTQYMHCKRILTFLASFKHLDTDCRTLRTCYLEITFPSSAWQSFQTLWRLVAWRKHPLSLFEGSLSFRNLSSPWQLCRSLSESPLASRRLFASSS